MNVIRKLKERRIRTQKSKETQARLSQIPESRLPGISTLPVELWSQILEHILLEQRYALRNYLNGTLFHFLQFRFVCHAFDEGIQRVLKWHLTINHIPYRSFLRSLLQAMLQDETHHYFRNALLASALYNSTRTLKGPKPGLLITSRLRNCTLIAQHISSNHTPQHQQHLLKTFCTAASTARCCWSYIFTLRHGQYGFVERVDTRVQWVKDGDLRLEVALLVASGYKYKDVKKWMVVLCKQGRLVGYRRHAVYLEGPYRSWVPFEYGPYGWPPGRVRCVNDEVMDAIQRLPRIFSSP